MDYVQEDMYYIIELRGNIKFRVSIYQLKNLPENAVEFTIVNPSRNGDFPRCYSVKLDTRFHDDQDGLNEDYVNGDTILVQENIAFARDYEALNRAFIESRVMHDVATR